MYINRWSQTPSAPYWAIQRLHKHTSLANMIYCKQGPKNCCSLLKDCRWGYRDCCALQKDCRQGHRICSSLQIDSRRVTFHQIGRLSQEEYDGSPHPGFLEILKGIVSGLTQNNIQVMWDNNCCSLLKDCRQGYMTCCY